MTFAYSCIVIAMFIPLACAGYAKFSIKGYDNKAPREFLEKLTGKGRRANAAQQNFYETFPGFAAGVVAAHQMGAAQGCVNAIAATYVTARILYAVFYVENFHILRSVSWAVAFIAIISLYFAGP